MFKSKIKNIFIMIAFLIVPLSIAKAEMDDAIIAIVNDEVITHSELNEYLNAMLLQAQSRGLSPLEIQQTINEFKDQGIHRLVDDKLIVSKAEEIGIEIKPSAIDNEVEDIKQRYPSDQDFMNALIVNGSTLTDLRDKITEQLKVKYVVELEVQSKIFVNPHEVTKFYSMNEAQFQLPERVDLESIFIPYEKNKTLAIEQAEKALAALKNGAEFEKVAQTYSKSSNVGTIQRGQMIPQVEKAVFALKLNEITNLVHTDTGIFIFKLKERLPASTMPLNEVKEEITAYLYQQKFKDRYKKWIAKLKDDAYIEIK